MPWRVPRGVLRRLFSARISRSATPPVTDRTALNTGVADPATEAVQTGDRLRDGGDFAAAVAFYEIAIGLAPARTDVRVQLGNMLKDTGRLAEAEAQYRRAMLERPADADINVQLGHLWKMQGRRSAAIAAYQRALALDRCSAPALRELAQMGEAAPQAQVFQAQLRAGAVDALLRFGHQLDEMRNRLDEMARQLPDLTGRVAFPIGLYSLFRENFDIPAPPPEQAGRDCFTIILPADRESLDTLHQQLLGVRSQRRSNWRLIAVGTDPARRRVVALAAAQDPRIAWHDFAAGVVDGERAAAASIAEGWIVFLAAGAVLDGQALAWFAAAAALGPAVAFVADEESGTTVQGRVVRTAPCLRQVVDHDTLLECNPYGETIAVRADAYAAIAPGLTQATVSAQRSLLLLGLAQQGRVGHVPYPLVWRCDADPTVPPVAAHEQAVRAHLTATGLPVDIDRPGADCLRLSVRWHPAAPPAAMAVIIATRDNAEDVRLFADTLAMTADRPGEFEILVIDNGTRDDAQLRILAELATRPGVQVVHDDQPFNWSRLNNRAAALVVAPLLVFANDDMRMLSTGWDTILRGLLNRAEVGAVGARLLYDDDTVQHAGILFGWQGSVIHDGLFEPVSVAGPAYRWHVTRATSAVTGAFLAIRRDDFFCHGGFDEARLPVAYSDVDLALKLRMSGLRVLYTPRITLMHHESKSRGLDHLDVVKAARNRAERFVMAQRWGEALGCDPGVNPTWRDATVPFRMIAAPSADHVRAHVIRCAGGFPWLPDRPSDGETLT